MTFAVAFVVSLAVLATRGRGAFVAWRQAPAVWALGVGGLFGYHFFYFVSPGNAPAADASLIAYLWPLLIVVFSALLPGERLHWIHLAGAAMVLPRAATLVPKGGPLAFHAPPPPASPP